MSFREQNSLRYFVFNTFEENDLVQGIYTRHGGVSPEHWSSLNVGGSNGDLRNNVIENRKRLFSSQDRPVESLFDVWQVHSSEVICTQEPRPLDAPHRQADAILTDQPGVTLFMRFADCVPIFLFDPRRRVVGMVHAGWLGTVRKIVMNAVNQMKEVYLSNLEDIYAGIGPAIGVDHYVVKEDVFSQVNKAFGIDGNEFLVSINGDYHFNLALANERLLRAAGIKRIENANICTACNLNDWYSHRAENGKTGRFGAMIGLKK